MALSNYGELKTAVGVWINKSNLAAYIPDFISLAAARIYYGSADPTMPSDPVRVLEMQARETPTLTSGTFPLPARYLETIRIRVSDGNSHGNLDYVAPAAFANYEDHTDYAKIYTVMEGKVHYRGTSGTLTHDYYNSFAAFSADVDTNALLTNTPGVWLWGSLVEASIFQKDDAEAARAFRMFVSAVRGANRTLVKAVQSSLVMKAR